jgi:hypothetical protein
MKKIFLLAILANLLCLQLKSQCTFGSFPPTHTINPGWTNGAWLAKQFTLSSTATLTGLGMNAAVSTPVSYIMSMFTDASGQPGSLIAVSSQGTLGLGQNTISIPTATVIPAGNYWIMVYYNSNGGSATVGYTGTTPIMYQPGTPTPPANNSTSWSAGSSYDIDYWAIINTPQLSVSGGSAVCTGSTKTLTANGAASYTWNAGAAGASIAVSPTTSTVYTLSGTSAGGCIATINPSLAVNPLPTITVAGSNSLCSGSFITQTASGASTYTWSTGATTSTVSISPAINSSYTVTATDANGCVGTANPFVSVYALPVLTVSGNSSLCMGASLSQTVSGASTYSWNTGATTATVLVTPTANVVYSVTGTYTNGCAAMITRPVVVYALPTVAISGSSAVCIGSSLTQTVSGASTYTWNTAANTTTILISPTTNTVYSVNATDANGCAGSATKSITVNALPTLAISANATVCAGTSLTQTASGASTYTWNTGANTTTISVAPTTNTVYSVTGTNTNGCTGTASKTITVNALPSLTISGTSTMCVGTSVTQTVSGASSYTWTPAAFANTITLSPSTTTVYSVTGMDANGCTSTANKTITVNALPVLTISGSSAVCVGTSVTQTVSGASTYSWNTSANTATILIAPTTNTIYSVSGTDANGCVGTANKSITVNALPVLTISGNSTVCMYTLLTETVSGAVSYSWNMGATTTTISAMPVTNTVYTVSGIDANGCTGTASLYVVVNALPLLFISGSTVTCAGTPVMQSVSGAATYSWSTGASTASVTLSPTATTVYSVNGTDTNGCSSAITETITVSALPTLSLSLSNVTLCAGETATINASGATVWLWNTGATGAFIAVSPTTTTTYSVTGTDVNNCTNTATIAQPVTICTGIAQQTADKISLLVSPNPNNGFFKVSLSGADNVTTLEIFSTSGALLKSEKLTAQDADINISDLANGLYYLVVHTNTARSVVKLVKE